MEAIGNKLQFLFVHMFTKWQLAWKSDGNYNTKLTGIRKNRYIKLAYGNDMEVNGKVFVRTNVLHILKNGMIGCVSSW